MMTTPVHVRPNRFDCIISSNGDSFLDKNIDIRSYGDFKRLVRNQTAKSMQEFYDNLYFTKHVGSKKKCG